MCQNKPAVTRIKHVDGCKCIEKFKKKNTFKP